MTTNFAPPLNHFLKVYLPSLHRSRRTIESYRDSFTLLLTFIKTVKKQNIEKLTIEKIKKQWILDFLTWIEDERGVCAKTRNNRLAAIKSFYKYLVEQLDIDHMEIAQQMLQIRSSTVEEKIVKYLKKKDVELLLRQPDRNTKRGLRDASLLALMYDSGGRVQEIIDLTLDNLYFNQESDQVKLFGKGAKERTNPIRKATAKLLQSYIKENQITGSEHPLFFNSQKSKLTRAGFLYIVKKYLLLAKMAKPKMIIKGMGCHTLRHSIAMHWLQAGNSLTDIMFMLGHKNYNSTQVYAYLDIEMKAKVLATVTVKNQRVKALWKTKPDILAELRRI